MAVYSSTTSRREVGARSEKAYLLTTSPHPLLCVCCVHAVACLGPYGEHQDG